MPNLINTLNENPYEIMEHGELYKIILKLIKTGKIRVREQSSKPYIQRFSKCTIDINVKPETIK